VFASAAEMKAEFEAARAMAGFLDSNTWIGPCAGPAFARAESVDDLLVVLDDARTPEALVSHFASLHYDPAQGNELLLGSVESREGLWAAVVLTPDTRGELDADECLKQMLNRKARAARLFPRSHSFGLQEWLSGPLLSAMERRRLPLILQHSEQGWAEIRSLCLAHPALPVLVEGTGKKILYDNRVFYQLLADCPNFHLELHNLTNYLGVEDIVSRFGADRLIYGSYAPVNEPAAAQMVVTHARVSDGAKKQIAGGNIRRLIAEVLL